MGYVFGFVYICLAKYTALLDSLGHVLPKRVVLRQGLLRPAYQCLLAARSGTGTRVHRLHFVSFRRSRVRDSEVPEFLLEIQGLAECCHKNTRGGILMSLDVDCMKTFHVTTCMAEPW